MRVVAKDADFLGAFRDAGSEAANAFGDDRLYLEKYLERPRHVEVQILADAHGRVVSLANASAPCSGAIKKWWRKLLHLSSRRTYARKWGMPPYVSRAPAVRKCRHGGISRRRALQFLFSRSEYAVAGGASRHGAGHRSDLVKLQIAIAAGHRLPFAWETLTPRGHAMEVRLYARTLTTTFFRHREKSSRARFPAGRAFASTRAFTKAGPCRTITTRCSAS